MLLIRFFIQALLLAVMSVTAAYAQPLKIGLILPMSGPFASYGTQILNGAKLYMQKHGNTVAGRSIELIVKDDTGIAPDLSKRHAQELLVRNQAEILAGFGLSPSAFAVAPLASQAKVPMVVLNAATASIPQKSPYITRVSFTLPQVTAPIASWAASNGINSAYTIVADYGPGHDAEKQFIETFTEAGGSIVGSVRTPVNNPDFSAYLQRAKDAAPDAVFLFVPAGEQGVAFLKGFSNRGLGEQGIKIIATGDLTDEDVINTLGDAALGVITAFHYSQAHKSPENHDFTQAYLEAWPKSRPNFMAVAGYDGMHLIYQALEKTHGSTKGDAFMQAVKGMEWHSPRGPVSINEHTRDINQTVYIRKVERVDDQLQNIEFDAISNQ